MHGSLRSKSLVQWAQYPRTQVDPVPFREEGVVERLP